MDQTRNDELIEQLLVEITVQRLITRGIVGYMMANSRKPLSRMIEDLEEAAAKTSPDLFPLHGVDPDLQARASVLAKGRALALLSQLGTAIAPLRAQADESEAA